MLILAAKIFAIWCVASVVFVAGFAAFGLFYTRNGNHPLLTRNTASADVITPGMIVEVDEHHGHARGVQIESLARTGVDSRWVRISTPLGQRILRPDTQVHVLKPSLA